MVDWCGRSLLSSSIWWARRTSRRRSGTAADRGLRVHAGGEAELGGVHVADAGQVGLVEQRLAERSLGVSGEVGERALLVPVRAEQVGAEVPDDVVLGRAVEQLDDAEREAHRRGPGRLEDDPGGVRRAAATAGAA